MDLYFDSELLEFGFFKKKEPVIYVTRDAAYKESFRAMALLRQELSDYKYKSKLHFSRGSDIKEEIYDWDDSNSVTLISLDLWDCKKNARELSDDETNEVYGPIYTAVNNLNNPGRLSRGFKLDTDGDWDDISVLLMFNIDKNSVDENTLQLSFDRDRKNQEFLYEFGLSNTRFNGYLVSVNGNLEGSKFDKNTKKMYGKSMQSAFMNFIYIEIYKYKKSIFGDDDIYVDSDFFKKYGSKTVYIYKIINGDIKLSDKGSILDTCKKYKINVLDNGTYTPLMELSDKSSKDVKIAFNISKDAISNELKKYDEYTKYIEWKSFNMNGLYSLICVIDAEKYYKTYSGDDMDEERLFNNIIKNLKGIEKKINNSKDLKNGFHIQLDLINNDDDELGFFLLYNKDSKYIPA